MANRLSEMIRTMFPSDFGELTPVKEHWWQKIDWGVFKKAGLRWYLSAFALLMILSSFYYYNALINVSSNVETAHEQIKVQLQRRKDLIINLSKMVLAYEEHESNMFKYMADKRAASIGQEAGLKARIKEMGLHDLAKLQAEGADAVLGSMMALAENYPQLALSANFQKLMDALINTEDRIVDARMKYNDFCNVYSNFTAMYPSNIYAFLFGFKQSPYAKVDKDVESFNHYTYDKKAASPALKKSGEK